MRVPLRDTRYSQFMVRKQIPRDSYNRGHRKYLPKDHKFRKQKKLFDGHEEHGQPPFPLFGDEILRRVDSIPNEWGTNKRKRGKDDNMESTLACWKKKLIFFNSNIGALCMCDIALM